VLTRRYKPRVCGIFYHVYKKRGLDRWQGIQAVTESAGASAVFAPESEAGASGAEALR